MSKHTPVPWQYKRTSGFDDLRRGARLAAVLRGGFGGGADRVLALTDPYRLSATRGLPPLPVPAMPACTPFRCLAHSIPFGLECGALAESFRRESPPNI